MATDATQNVAAARRPPGGPSKGDRRRQAIVDAVERLLRERTIAELSVESIAGEAGISRSGFYFYFESKYAALGDTLGDVADEMARAADEFFVGTDEPPAVYMPRSLGGVREMWLRHADLLVAVVDAAHSDTGARALWDAWLTRWYTSVADRIESERRAGRAAEGPDAVALARTLVLMNVSVFDDCIRRQLPEEEAQRSLDALIRVWLTAIWS